MLDVTLMKLVWVAQVPVPEPSVLISEHAYLLQDVAADMVAVMVAVMVVNMVVNMVDMVVNMVYTIASRWSAPVLLKVIGTNIERTQSRRNEMLAF